MADFELPDMPKPPQVTPHMLVGAVSPLWTYFGVAAAGGLAYWWMTRWTDRANLEALFGRTMAAQALVLPPAAPTQLAEAANEFAETVEAAVSETAEQVAEAVETIAHAAPLPEAPVGGEAAPMSPMAEALSQPEVISQPEATVAPEPTALSTTEPAVEVPAAPEATAEPLPEPISRTRGRKAPPANGLEI